MVASNMGWDKVPVYFVYAVIVIVLYKTETILSLFYNTKDLRLHKEKDATLYPWKSTANDIFQLTPELQFFCDAGLFLQVTLQMPIPTLVQLDSISKITNWLLSQNY